MSAHDAIDITRYAEVLAHIRHFPADKHAEVIARLGIRRRDWDASAAKWMRVRDAERMSGKLDVTVRYGRVLADTRARLEALRPTLESLGPYPGPDGAPAESIAPAASKPAPDAKPDEALASAEPAVLVPSYLAAELHAARIPDALPLPPPVHRPLSEIASTVLGAAAPAGVVTPFAAPSSAADSFQRAVAHAAEVQGPADSRREGVGSGTVAAPEDITRPPLPPGVAELTLEQYASLRAELETRPEDAAAISTRYGVPIESRATLDAHWKARFSADPPLRMAFARAYAMHVASSKAGPASQVPIASSGARKAPREIASTMLDTVPPPVAPMPFAAQPASAEESFQRAVAHAEAVQGPADVPRGAADSSTAALFDSGATPPLPAGVVDLTVEQYASLRVELELSPERTASILSRYGVSGEGREGLDAYWRARFQADPLLRMEFARAYAAYLAWLRNGAGE